MTARKGAKKEKERTTLTRNTILRTAISYADEHGTDSLSMRVLAGELGCGVMSLYNHVSTKDDMFDGMVDLIASEIDLPPAKVTDWKAALRDTAVSAQRTLAHHAWAVSCWSTQKLGPAKLQHMESILRVLREAGFSVSLACRAYHAITMHIVGFTFQQLDFPLKGDAELKEAAGNFIRDFADHDIPYFMEHVRHHLSDDHEDDEFTFMLDLILDGLERMKNSD